MHYDLFISEHHSECVRVSVFNEGNTGVEEDGYVLVGFEIGNGQEYGGPTGKFFPYGIDLTVDVWVEQSKGAFPGRVEEGAIQLAYETLMRLKGLTLKV